MPGLPGLGPAAGTAAAHLGPRVSELLDGRLGGPAEAEVRAHLHGCRSCAAAVHAEQRVRATLRDLDAPGPPPDLLAGLMALSRPAWSPSPALPTAPLRPVRPPGGARPGAGPHGPRRTATRGRLATAVVGTVGLASAGALGVAAFSGVAAAPAVGRVPSVADVSDSADSADPTDPAAARTAEAGLAVLGTVPATVLPPGARTDAVAAVFRLP